MVLLKSIKSQHGVQQTCIADGFDNALSDKGVPAERAADAMFQPGFVLDFPHGRVRFVLISSLELYRNLEQYVGRVGGFVCCTRILVKICARSTQPGRRQL